MIAKVFMLMSLMMTSLTVQAQACKFKENCNCSVPGSTQKWHLAYCSYKTENENLDSEPVRKCMSSTFASGGDSCAQNQYWKNEMCKVFHKNNAEKEERCKKKFFIPKVVGT